MAALTPLTDTALRLSRIVWEPAIGLPLLIGMGIRLVLIPWFSDPFNFWAGHLSSELLASGYDPFRLFASDPRFQVLGPWPYPPEYFLFALSAFGASNGISALYGIWVRMPNVLADAGTSVLLFRISTRLGATAPVARASALAYLMNPFSIVLSAVWGVNDPIPVFLTVLALYCFLGKTDRSLALGSMVLGIGIATKIYPAIFVPLALALVPGLFKKVRLLAIAAIAPVIASVPFLLADSQAYASTVFGFAGGTSGSNRAQLDPQFTIWRVIAWFAGPLDSTVGFVAAAALVAGLLWIYYLVGNRKLDLMAGFGLVIMLAYLLSVRWSPSYFLWAVPFTTLYALSRLAGWRKWIMLLFWAPSLAYALIFNGWYPDRFSGGSGLPYWAHISGVPNARVLDAFPPETVPALTAAAIVFGVLIGVLLLWPTFLGPTPVKHRPVPHPMAAVARPRSQNQNRTLIAISCTFFVLLFVGSVAFQTWNGRPVNPTDFARFRVLPGGAFSLTDEFRADILSFRWVFHGGGSYVLHPNGTSGILFDTSGVGETAFIENRILADRVTARVVFQVQTLYGTDPLLILRANSSWLGVVQSPGPRFRLLFFDEAAGRGVSLGFLGPGWSEARVSFSPAGQVIEALGLTRSLPPTNAISAVDFGHTDPLADGGGALVLGQVAMEWFSDQNGITYLPLGVVILADLLALVPLFVIAYGPPLRGIRGESLRKAGFEGPEGP